MIKKTISVFLFSTLILAVSIQAQTQISPVEAPSQSAIRKIPPPPVGEGVSESNATPAQVKPTGTKAAPSAAPVTYDEEAARQQALRPIPSKPVGEGSTATDAATISKLKAKTPQGNSATPAADESVKPPVRKIPAKPTNEGQ